METNSENSGSGPSSGSGETPIHFLRALWVYHWWLLFFGLTFVAPLLAFGSPLVRSLLHDHGTWAQVVMFAQLFAATLSWAFLAGVETQRYAGKVKDNRRSPMHPWFEKWVQVPMTRVQYGAACVAALPTGLASARLIGSEDPFCWATFGVFLAVAAAGVALTVQVKRFVMWLLKRLGKGEEAYTWLRLLSGLVGFFVFWAIIGWIGRWLDNHERLTAFGLVLGTLAVAGWAGSLLGTRRTSTRLWIFAAFVAIYLLTVAFPDRLGSSHEFRVAKVVGGSLEEHTPHRVATRGGQQDIVVVCAAGGGALSAAWTVHALRELTEAPPDSESGAVLPDGSIRLMSGVSGGSVGIATWAVAHWPTNGEPTTDTSPAEAATQAVGTSSLAAVVHGFVYSDMIRAVSMGITGSRLTGRGACLDEAFDRNIRKVPGMHLADGDRLTLARLGEHADSGALPSIIFNTTAMETGRRVMITPLRFHHANGSGTAAEHAKRLGRRADTMSEYLLGDRKNDVFLDMSIWTAARLSATFPYVTPAAAAALPEDYKAQQAAMDELFEKRKVGDPPLRRAPATRQHFLDGGYHDNNGVASAIDWIEEVCAAESAGGERLLRRIAIIELRAYPRPDPAAVPGSEWLLANLLGPVVGVYNARNGQAELRNDSELASLIERYAPDEETGKAGIEIRVFRFEPSPTAVDGPLNWRLTEAQKRAVVEDFENGGTVFGPSGNAGEPLKLVTNKEQLKELRRFFGTD